MSRLKIAVVDDELSMREYLELLLGRSGYAVSTFASVEEFEKASHRMTVDLVISDMKIGSGSGLSVLRTSQSLTGSPEVILITAFGTPAAAVEAMRQGAYDYICKPFDNEEFMLLVQKALEKRALLQENRQLKESLVPVGGKFFLGESPAMKSVWALVEKVAPTRSTVLVTGESGTGKEVVARAIHFKSNRATAPFVPVNCGAIAEGVLESELFGHMRGSFTGATGDREGILVSAGEGTILLDEVGELPLSTQVKLLRVLQERTVKPVGSSKEIPFEARILAATNRTLEDEVKAGRFREDLLYRLNVISIELPPLRKRPEDIPRLAIFFLGKAAQNLGRPRLEFHPHTLALLEKYSFTGNVRQLENLVERAATLADGDIITPDLLPPGVRGMPDEVTTTAGGEVMLPDGFSLERHLDTLERRYLNEAMKQSGGVKTKAAEVLGLTFRSFRYRLAKQGMGDKEDA